MHTMPPNPVLRSEHLGLYKSFYVPLVWSYDSSPNHEESYQSFSEPEEMENNQDLILWPPLVIIHNAFTKKKKRWLIGGIGNQEMVIKAHSL
jgi:hypothetical protein